LALIILIPLYVIFLYNRLVRSRNMVEEGWSGIDVQLKRRADLIPNLVETVKGYATHEKTVLEEVTAARAAATSAQSVEGTGKAADMMTAALGRLFAVAENYPALQADDNFRQLQDQLAETEDMIQKARRYYNGAVRTLNTFVEQFPSNLVAGQFRFVRAEYFEIEDPKNRALPEVVFTE
jgi:LemA protein